jgi:hypothetical protein
VKKTRIIGISFSLLVAACSPKNSAEQAPTKSKSVIAFGATEKEIDNIAAERVRARKITSPSLCLSTVPREVQELEAYIKEPDSVIVSYSNACRKYLAEQNLQDMKDKMRKPVSSPTK